MQEQCYMITAQPLFHQVGPNSSRSTGLLTFEAGSPVHCCLAALYPRSISAVVVAKIADAGGLIESYPMLDLQQQSEILATS